MKVIRQKSSVLKTHLQEFFPFFLVSRKRRVCANIIVFIIAMVPSKLLLPPAAQMAFTAFFKVTCATNIDQNFHFLNIFFSKDYIKDYIKI